MSAPTPDSPKLDVIAVDHIYVAVRDFARSVAFYDRVMRLLGFKKGTSPIAGEPHAHYFNRVTQYTIRPARDARSRSPRAACSSTARASATSATSCCAIAAISPTAA